jgi:predicted sulfurtransferase
MINKQGYESLDEVVMQGMKPLTVEEFKKYLDNDDVILLDTRNELNSPKVCARLHRYRIRRPLC